ncbi:hypothetical protein Tco_0564027 [Tanacetum coccineum]
MLNVFESMEREVDEIKKGTKNEILQKEFDRLLEVTLADDVRNLVMHSYVENVTKKFKAKNERFSKESKDVENKSNNVDKFCDDAVVVKQKLQQQRKWLLSMKKTMFLLQRLLISNKSLLKRQKMLMMSSLNCQTEQPNSKHILKNLENTKVVFKRQLARKVDDSKVEKDQFLKEINLLRTQLENVIGKSVETTFDKPSILEKPPADKLLTKSQLQK